MKTRIVAGITVALLIVAGVIASAQSGPGEGPRPPRERGAHPMPPPPPPPPFGVPNIEQLTRDFSLTEAQVNELKAFLETEKSAVDSLMTKLEEQHRAIEAASAEGRFDEAQIRTLATQQSETMTNLIVEQQRVKSKIYNVMTPEQRAKLQQFHKRRGPGERGPGAPGGPQGRGPGGRGVPPPPPPGL